MSPTADTMSSTEGHTNVDYLLERLTIAEIIDIQNKLKTDVERKKQELKQLVGERYRDLMEAVDTIKQMNGCADSVLTSLVALRQRQSNHFLKTKSSSDENIVNDIKANETDRRLSETYKSGLILKLITELPLNVWSSLEKEDLLRATYDFFYGQHLCNLFRKSMAIETLPNLFKRYETEINRFKEIIVKKCWIIIQKNFRDDSFDESANADIFACLMLIQDLTSKQLFDTIISKRKDDIKQCLIDSNQLKTGLQSFINILFNTIKCVDFVFFRDNQTKAKSLLHQRYYRLMKITYDIPLLRRVTLTEETSSDLIEFKINAKTVIDSIESQYMSEEIKKWISDIKVIVAPLLQQLLEPIDSVNYICLALNDINESLRQSQKLNDWDEYCEDLMSNYLPLMDHFIIDLVNARIKTIINQSIEKSLQSLIGSIKNALKDEKSVKYEDLEVIEFVWNQSDGSLSKKSLAQIPVVDNFCSHLDQSLQSLLKDIKIIKDFNFKLIKSHELEEIEFYLMNCCQSMIERLKDFLESIEDSERDQLVITLFCGHFLRQLSQSNSHLMKCFESSSPNRQYSWSKAKDILISYSYKCYKKVYDLKIQKLFEEISDQSLTDLNQFITNSFVWSKIEITEESEEGKTISSKIEVPLQISLFLHKCLTDLCREVNRVNGHTIGRTVAISTLSSLTHHLVELYERACHQLSAKECSPNIKQTIALQLYFDLLFVKQLLGTTRDESIKANEVPKIVALIDKTESFIDPFDLHVFFPHIQTNVAKLSKSTSVLFGILIPDSIAVNSESNSKNNQINEIHNIMAFNSRQNAFTLLNVNSVISKKY